MASFRNISALALSVLIAAQSQALTPPVKALVDLETKSNGAGVRSNQPVQMPHYEIPLKYLRESREFTLDPKIYDSLVFEKNGELYVRWVVNPEDTKWFKQVEEFMISKGLTPERKTHFIGYQTASRSYIVEDSKNGAQFSIKSSTDKTGGAWRDKKQQFDDGFDIRLISDLVARVEKKQGFKNVVIMQEPLTFGIKSIDQSIVVRDLSSLSRNGDFFYVPGFSVLHEDMGRKIAEKNGSKDPYQFWTKHYIEPMGRAAGEVAAKLGMWYDSPHGQNFLVELDKQLKPTGRMVLRDLGDVYVSSQMMNQLGQKVLLREFSEPENILSKLAIAFGPLHGNTPPSWVSPQQYMDWEKVFKKAVVEELSVQTKIPAAKLNKPFQTGLYSYISGVYEIDTPEWQNYIKSMKPVPKLCLQVFLPHL